MMSFSFEDSNQANICV